MKKCFALLLTLAMVFALAVCGGNSTPTSIPSTPSAPASALISVGVVTNDPNESGYCTANDRAIRKIFTEANGYKATFYNSNAAQPNIQSAPQELQDKHYLRKHGPNAYYGQGKAGTQPHNPKEKTYSRIIPPDGTGACFLTGLSVGQAARQPQAKLQTGRIASDRYGFICRNVSVKNLQVRSVEAMCSFSSGV